MSCIDFESLEKSIKSVQILKGNKYGDTTTHKDNRRIVLSQLDEKFKNRLDKYNDEVDRGVGKRKLTSKPRQICNTKLDTDKTHVKFDELEGILTGEKSLALPDRVVGMETASQKIRFMKYFTFTPKYFRSHSISTPITPNVDEQNLSTNDEEEASEDTYINVVETHDGFVERIENFPDDVYENDGASIASSEFSMDDSQFSEEPTYIRNPSSKSRDRLKTLRNGLYNCSVEAMNSMNGPTSFHIGQNKFITNIELGSKFSSPKRKNPLTLSEGPNNLRSSSEVQDGAVPRFFPSMFPMATGHDGDYRLDLVALAANAIKPDAECQHTKSSDDGDASFDPSVSALQRNSLRLTSVNIPVPVSDETKRLFSLI